MRKYFNNEWRATGVLTAPILLILLYIDFQFTNIGFLQLHSLDDYVFHGSLRHMYDGLVSGDLKAMFGYGFYQYGFIYFFINLVMTAPAFAVQNTALALAIPRIVTSVFAVGGLIFFYKTCRQYVSQIHAVLSTAVIATMPAFWFNATWFHPDWSITFFLLGFIYFITIDKWKYGRCFWMGVGFYALAVAFKYQAITAMPLLLLYIFYNPLRNISLKNFASQAKLYSKALTLILVVFILSNPYIMHPIGWKVFSGSFLSNMTSNATNHGQVGSVSILEKIELVVHTYYMPHFLFILFSAAAAYLAIKYFAQKNHNIHTVIAINFLINISYLLVFVNKGWQHYYLPVIIPGLLCLLYFVRFIQPRTLSYVLITIIFAQGIFFMSDYRPLLFESQNKTAPDFNTYSDETNVEINAFILASLQHTVTAEDNILITAYTPFEYEALGLDYTNVRTVFGPLAASSISLDAYIIAQKTHWGTLKSETEIAASFKPIHYIILRKDTPFIDINKLNKIRDIELYLSASALVSQLYNQEIGYNVIAESEYVVIFKYE